MLSRYFRPSVTSIHRILNSRDSPIEKVKFDRRGAVQECERSSGNYYERRCEAFVGGLPKEKSSTMMNGTVLAVPHLPKQNFEWWAFACCVRANAFRRVQRCFTRLCVEGIWMKNKGPFVWSLVCFKYTIRQEVSTTVQRIYLLCLIIAFMLRRYGTCKLCC
jgi:hypothetical protein